MGMPITVEIVGEEKDTSFIEVFNYFSSIDATFSTYKKQSEISKINRGEIKERDYSQDMKTVLALSMQTKKETQGYFDIYFQGYCDPSGLVKGWAIGNAATLLTKRGYTNFYINAGGDIAVKGKNAEGKPWAIGIQNPFSPSEIVKVISLADGGIATSGTYIRGQHIYNPITQKNEIKEIRSISIIGPTIYDADRFATAAFAMGKKGIHFIESLSGFEGYMIDANGIATETSGFKKYVVSN